MDLLLKRLKTTPNTINAAYCFNTADFSTLSREKTERERNSTTAQGCYCFKISKEEFCDCGSIFTITSERLYPETGDTEGSVNFTGPAMKVELVLFMFLEFISLHKTVEKSTCVATRMKYFLNLPLSWWY